MITVDTVQSAQAGDSTAMWHILTEAEPMMRNIIRTVTAGGQASADDVEDLLQESRAVLIARVQAYDTAGPATLQTRAYQEIYGAISRAWVTTRSAVTPEPDVVLRVRRALAATEGDAEAACRQLEALPKGSRVSRPRFLAVLDLLREPETFYAGAGADGDTLPLAETLSDTREDDIADRAARRDLAERALASVTPRRALVLRASYGVGMPPMEDAEIGGHLGHVTPTRVRRIRWDGIQQARAALSVAA
ncbi:hypothetical protein ATKI12_6941 [Kitasatospora sp. Ki12]